MHAKETKEVERRGVDLVLACEERVGRQPVEQAFNNKGFDILSTDPGGDTYRIEVKARLEGAEDFFVTHNEVMLGKNAVPRYRLALVSVSPDGAEQDRVDRPRPAARIVNVVTVDSDQSGAAFGQQASRGFGEEGMADGVIIGPPVAVPAGSDQNGLAGDVQTIEGVGVDPVRHRANEKARQGGELLEIEPGHVGAIRITMKRRVEISAGIGHHVDPADLEGSAVVVG